ncbi:MAG: hypothetical protein ACK48X_06390, partial [Planctomycetota bacterium]
MNIRNLDQAFEALKTFDWGSDRAPLAPIEAAAVAAKDSSAQAALEQKLLGALGGNLNRAGKDFV